MDTPQEPSATTPAEPTSLSSARVEDLRQRLRPRGIATPGAPELPAGERLALERVQALELQLSYAQQREREMTELAVRDGNRLAQLEIDVAQLADLAARTEAAERALFEAENRAETATRSTELMESELMSTRAEVDRLRARVVELESSLRRALAEVGAATAQRVVIDRDDADLRAAQLRAERAEEDLMAARGLADEANVEAHEASTRAAEAEVRLADVEERLTSLDERIAGLSGETPAAAESNPWEAEPVLEPEEPEKPEIVVDLRDAESDVTEPVRPPASRWSEWRAT
jgi:DNA repair exonuclease SbcCD ATPase subunit